MKWATQGERLRKRRLVDLTTICGKYGRALEVMDRVTGRTVEKLMEVKVQRWHFKLVTIGNHLRFTPHID